MPGVKYIFYYNWLPNLRKLWQLIEQINKQGSSLYCYKVPLLTIKPHINLFGLNAVRRLQKLKTHLKLVETFTIFSLIVLFSVFISILLRRLLFHKCKCKKNIYNQSLNILHFILNGGLTSAAWLHLSIHSFTADLRLKLNI